MSTPIIDTTVEDGVSIEIETYRGYLRPAWKIANQCRIEIGTEGEALGQVYLTPVQARELHEKLGAWIEGEAA